MTISIENMKLPTPCIFNALLTGEDVMVAAVKYVCSYSKYVVEFCNGGEGAQKCPYQMVKNFLRHTVPQRDERRDRIYTGV